jgi:hypothetical protein
MNFNYWQVSMKIDIPLMCMVIPRLKYRGDEMTLSLYFNENIYKKLFGKTWPKWVGGILLAILNILLFLYIMPIGGVYPAIADRGIWMYKIAGLDIKPPWGTLTLPHLSVISVLILA